MAIPVETFFLSPEGQGTLQARIQQMVAEGILSGRFRRGEKLPSSRKLAAHLGISRITVTLAYTELQANDYLTARGRSGYFVSDNAPDPPPDSPPEPGEDRVDWARILAGSVAQDDSVRRPPDWARYRFPFIYGQPDPRLFDQANWRLCALQALGARDFAALTEDQYDRDDPELVEFITRHTLPRRGITAGADQVLVTLGAQNALWLAAQVLLAPGRTAAIETPCYPTLRAILAQRGCKVRALPVDADGLPPETLEAGTDVVFTTPSHQCPTSATMPLARRRALLDRAREIGALIVEDDYEFEMAYLKTPLRALRSLDGDGRVIYVGSFSKSLFPGARLGYLVGSAPFIRAARALRAQVLRHPPGLMQRTCAYFMRLGHYDALVRRTGRALTERRAVMERAIADTGLKIAGRGAHGGSAFWMEAPEGVDSAKLARTLLKQDVVIEPGAGFFGTEASPRNFYRLGYSSIPSERIAEGIGRIATTLASR